MATDVTLIGPAVVPGVVTAAAYASGDAFGTEITLTGLPVGGHITGVLWLDIDNEKIQKDITFFATNPADTTADNAAFDPPDADVLVALGWVSIGAGDYVAYANNAVGFKACTIPIVSRSGTVYARIQTRGADNIAASNIPYVGFYVSR